jgi:hypothetical protein
MFVEWRAKHYPQERDKDARREKPDTPAGTQPLYVIAK